MSDAVRVLVIDDDPLQIELVERALNRDGFEVHSVCSATAIAAEARRFAPDIVLIDVNMPEASGGRALSLARDASPAGTRCVLYSACDSSKLRVMAMDLGADAWISKSESVVEIARRLKELHARREQAR
jgi:DNA-binding response OmpR family regulator